jgi:hypothetical protein
LAYTSYRSPCFIDTPITSQIVFWPTLRPLPPNEGDQILVKVLALEGNKIKLSRKAVLREQKEKLKGDAAKKPVE